MVLYFFGVDDSRLRAARAVVRIRAEMRKEQPTSTGVHVDAVMGSVPPRAGVNGVRRKKRKKVKEVAAMGKGRGGLGEWFEEKWVDISRPKEGGGFEPCGRADAESGKYPKCVPSSKAAAMSAKERKSAVRRKRKAEAEATRVDKKPVNVDTLVKSKNVPTDHELSARVKAEAKKKFDVYPSAYANAWLVREYKSRGGGYRVEKASFASRSEAGRYAAEQRWKGHAKQDNKTAEKAPTAKPMKGVGRKTAKQPAKKVPADAARTAYPKYSDQISETIKNWKQSTDKAFSEKSIERSAKYLQGRGAGDGTVSSQDKEFAKEMKDLITQTLDEENAKIVDALDQLKTKGSDRETSLKALKSSASRLRRTATKLEKEQESRGLKPSKSEDNTIAGMAMYTASMIFNKVADAVLREVAIAKEPVGKASSPAWQRKAGKNPKGGLNAKGRASYARETGGKLKAPVKAGDNPRRASFLARMGNMAGPERDANGEPTRLLLSLQAWGANSKAEARKKAKAISARNEKKVDKASFATRSEAGRYAANMRWQDNQSSPNIDTGAGTGYAGAMGTDTMTPRKSVKEVAASIRKDLKAAQKSGQLPADVKFTVKFVDADPKGYRPNTPRLSKSEIQILTENYEQWSKLSDDAKKLVGNIGNSHNPLSAYETRDGGNSVMVMQGRDLNIRPVFYKN